MRQSRTDQIEAARSNHPDAFEHFLGVWDDIIEGRDSISNYDSHEGTDVYGGAEDFAAMCVTAGYEVTYYTDDDDDDEERG